MKKRQEHAESDALFERLLSGDRYALSRAITLVESKRPQDRQTATRLVDLSVSRGGDSRRIGISGPPGVGKSTFIETMGVLALEKGYKVAVLAVDPTSRVSRGSILGDKTRMQRLSNRPDTFIRPSPAGDELGGVAGKTRECMFLCEAAGYDLVLVETVGVGQSEVAVHAMVDCFLLLIQPGSGDELQGIKRGIVELADILIVNKADGDQLEMAKKAKQDFAKAIHLLAPRASGWATSVSLHSAHDPEMVQSTWELLDRFFGHVRDSGFFGRNRQKQNLGWFESLITSGILGQIHSEPTLVSRLESLRGDIAAQKISPASAAAQFLEGLQLSG